MESLLKTLLTNYLNQAKGILAVSICDRDGLIITSVGKGSDQDETVIGGLSSIIDSYIDRIKSEFGTKNNFCNITSTGDKKFSYCSMGNRSILTTIADNSTTDIELRVFSEYVAGKVELILEGKQDVQLEIPEMIRVLAKTKSGKLPKGEFSTKVILTGDFKVGKTSLIKRFVENRFQESYISTIGVEISKKVAEISEETKINFIIWDIGGQLKSMAPYRARFYGGANAALIIMDRTRKETLNSVKSWYDDIRKSILSNIPVVIIGNKSDSDQVVVTEAEISKLAKEFGFHYILTSAKTGDNVNDAFLYIAFRFLENV